MHDVVFRGASFAYELQSPGHATPLFAYTQERSAAVPGDAVGLGWDPGAAVVLRDPP